MSLKVALEELGFGPCYHMTELFEYPEHARYWEAARRDEPANWNAFLDEYGSTTDWPACTFYAGLMKKYPDAKVLLTVRDPERWYQSTRSTIYEMSRLVEISPYSRPIFRLIGLLRPGMRAITRLTTEIIWGETFDGRFEERDHAIGVFERHNEEVRRRVPPEKLLVYEVKEGWEPLCEFLGVGVPDRPFPSLNDAAVMRRRVRSVRAIALAPYALLAVAGVLLLRRAATQTP